MINAINISNKEKQSKIRLRIFLRDGTVMAFEGNIEIITFSNLEVDFIDAFGHRHKVINADVIIDYLED